MSKNETTIHPLPFKEIEHTADIGLEVTGSTPEDLFQNAMRGFYFILCKNPIFSGSHLHSFDLQDETLEELLISFLNQSNYFAQVLGKFCSNVNRLKILENRPYYKLQFTGIYSNLSEESLSDLTEIKAATYHQLHIEKTGSYLSTKIIFDI